MIRFKLLLIIAVTALISCGNGNSGTEPGPEPKPNEISFPHKELRGVWVSTVGNLDWPSKRTLTVEQQKQEYINFLDKFKQYNINAVFVQVRPMADAFYPSAFEPWSVYLTGTQGKDPGYDPLQFMLDEAHKRGMEFHAWLNPYRISTDYTQFNPAANHIYRQHPEWTMNYDKMMIFRPALPEVREFLTSVVKDILTKYKVDGIHMDDYFYPYPKTGLALDDAADFQKYGTGYATIEDFRRGNVDKAIESIHNLIIKDYPDVLFSISPYAVWRNKKDDSRGSDTTDPTTNYDGLYADIRLWCEKGWIDFVVPQLYASTQNIASNFIKLSEWWPKNSFNVPVLVGYSLYRFGNPAEGTVYMDPLQLESMYFYARRQEKIVGGIQFTANSFTANKIDILSTLAKLHSEPSLIPFMGRSTLSSPAPVANLKVSSGSLIWDSTGSDMRFAVYKITDKTASLVAVTTEKSFKPASSGDYVVSAVNRDNTESKVSAIIKF